MAETWLKCSACRNPIPYGAAHWVCSVSTCNRARTRLVFCTVSCWDSHVAMLRHRDAWAVDAKAPSKDAWERELAANPPDPEPAPKPAVAPAVRRVVGDASPATAAAVEGHVRLADVTDRDMLIVVSKMKKYIKDRAGMNCGDAVAEVMSEHVRAICDEAIRAAGRDERKTVLDRDVPRPRR
ncbi:MAG TPA: hypothetical protein VGF94_14100 [Kofleriaceae bacterium]|jgi:hypothetical protein